MGLLDRIRGRRAPATKAEADRLVLRQLASRGADLTRARHVVHLLSFADEPAARAAAEAIAKAGYETTVTPPDARIAEWSVRAEAQRVVEATTIAGFRAWFERAAREHGGEYDGWEAGAKP